MCPNMVKVQPQQLGIVPIFSCLVLLTSNKMASGGNDTSQLLIFLDVGHNEGIVIRTQLQNHVTLRKTPACQQKGFSVKSDQQ